MMATALKATKVFIAKQEIYGVTEENRICREKTTSKVGKKGVVGKKKPSLVDREKEWTKSIEEPASWGVVHRCAGVVNQSRWT